jgi:hypothetical protein
MHILLLLQVGAEWLGDLYGVSEVAANRLWERL